MEAKWLTSKEVAEIKTKYPVGTKIKLIKMDDPYHPVPSGTIGTIRHVDDQGQLHTDWENHRTLPVIVDIDQFEVINEKNAEEKEGAAAC